MEVMFMQVFEHRDWVEAQMRQQVASFSDSLACAFLAAGSQPPLWLFPHSTPAKGKQGNIVRKQSLDLANLKRDDAVHFAHPTSHQVFKPKPLEFGGIKPGSCNITGSSETINQCKSSMSETILSKFTSVHPLNEDLSSTISIEASLHELLHSVSNPLPKKETTHAAENYSLEGPTSGAPKILGLLEKDILDDDRGHSPHPKKNMLEDGCRHDTHSHVCGAFNTCSLQSAPNLEKLLHKSVNDEHLYQSNILFPGTINHNGSCSASASDAFISARIEPFQMQTSLPKLSPEFDRTTTTVLENDVDKVSNSSPNYCNILYDGDACCISKKISCFPYPDTDVKVATVEDKILTGIDCVACGTLNTENYPITTSPTTFPRYALYEKNQHASLEFDEEGIDGGQQVSDGAIPCQSVDVYADCDETVQQYQSFSIPVPSKTKSSTIKERVFLGLRESTKLFDLSCNLSTKYKMGSKMKPLCGKYESLAARLEKLAKRCSINSVDTDWHDPSYDINKLRDPDKYSSDLNDPLLMSNVLTYDSENANSVQEDIDIPLTPLVEKYSLEKLSGRTRFNSECMGSIPELACFQIHEDSNIAEEDEKEEMLTGCPGINYSTKELTGRKPPDHVTSVYQNREKSSSLSIRYVDVGRFGLTTPKTSSMNANRDLHIRTDQAMKNPKENRASSIRKGKLSQPLQDSKSRAELLNQKNARHRSEANLGKGWKPSNTVTNMTPFAPLVKQNQQFRACG
uniref:Uncharacterized protein n=1 Tax=Avena sativa TaxID=4498 RepID=A0ACD5ZU44_AVESA